MATEVEQSAAHAAWLEERRTYIGSSEVFELLNYPQYAKGCARALGYAKLGVTPDFQVEENDALLRRGNILEPIAATIYEELMGRKVRRPAMDGHGHAEVRRHPIFPWAAAATDRLILAGHGGVTEVGDLEIKTRDQGAYHRIIRQGPFYGDVLQPQWSMFVTGHKWASLAVLGIFGGLPMLVVDARRDEEMMQVFQREGEQFADRVFGAGELPDPTFPASDQRCKVCAWRQTCRGQEIDQDELRELRTMSKASRELVQIDEPELAKTLQDIELLRKEKEAADTLLDIAKEHALELLGDREAALVRGFGKVYRMAASRSYFDSITLRRMEPEIYERYLVHRNLGTSYLRLYPHKVRQDGNSSK